MHFDVDLPVWLLSIPLPTSVHSRNVSGGGRVVSHEYGFASCGNGTPAVILLDGARTQSPVRWSLLWDVEKDDSRIPEPHWQFRKS
jgi:hypothetical protein